MERYERINLLHRILGSARYPVPVQRLIDELECSRATVYRDVAFLRDALGAPVEASEDPSGFYYQRDAADRFELPGLWLSPDELYALLAMQQLLTRSGTTDFLSEALEPVRSRIESLLQQQSQGKRWPVERIRVITSGTRETDHTIFRLVAGAVLQRQQLNFRYRARSTQATTLRHTSPQRLTHYRNNWYLDAWDHEREALRSFSLDRIDQAELSEERALDLPEADLEHQLASSYGIFSGPPRHWATIHFSARAARWVSEERWHSRQEGHFLPDGRYELRLPYSNPRELLMDVIRYGADATIIDPPSLRAEAQIQLQLALGNYTDPAC